MSKSKKPRRWPWVLLALVGLLALPAMIGLGYWVSTWGAGAVEEGTLLELKLAGGLTEGPEPTSQLLAELSPGSVTSLWDIRRALRRAADDEAVAGLLIIIEGVSLGSAARGELIGEIQRFRESGKPVHALIQADMVTEPELEVGSAASTLWVTPHAMWMVNGLQADVAFYRGTLDKLHVEPDFIMFKEYKSAGEPYSRKEMSAYFREALDDVVGDIQRHMWDGIIERRGVDRDAFLSLVQEGAFTPAQAAGIGLVDELGYLDQVREALRVEAGVEEAESPGWDGLALGRYLKRSRERAAETAGTVALIFGEGPIVASSARPSLLGGGQQISGPVLASAFREAIEDEDVDAIVFRVNSPGGSAVGSDLIWREIQRAKAAGKPVVVSMSTVAGSGGYWIAMGADAIVAHPDTITGSIGVVFGKFNLRGLYEWAGAHIESISFAKNADIMSPYETLDEEQRATMVAAIGAMYDAFTAKVAEGRGMELAAVQEIAKGRIWSGVDAVQNGLVDQLGGLDEALAIARERAGIEGEVALEVYPRQQDLLQQLFSGELTLETPAAVGADPASLEALLEELARPGVRVMMPEIRLR